MVSAVEKLPFDPAMVREYSEQHFAVSTMVNKYAALYRELRRRPMGAAVA
jgi:hypothetical protein